MYDNSSKNGFFKAKSRIFVTIDYLDMYPSHLWWLPSPGSSAVFSKLLDFFTYYLNLPLKNIFSNFFQVLMRKLTTNDKNLEISSIKTDKNNFFFYFVRKETSLVYFVTKFVLTYCEKKLFLWLRNFFEIRGWGLRICTNFLNH